MEENFHHLTEAERTDYENLFSFKANFGFYGSYDDQSTSSEEEQQQTSNDEPIPIDGLYKIIGEGGIEKIITSFYEKVWADTEHRWFSDEFKDLVHFEHAVWAQKMMWMDCMGAGMKYHGGSFRLSHHHKRGRTIMTTEGCIRWLYHMNQSLDEVINISFHPRHKQIRKTINSFLYLTLCKYSNEFKFNLEKAIETAPWINDNDYINENVQNETEQQKEE